jgi:N-acetylneuraminate synthase
MIGEFKRKYGLKAGLSDHTGSIYSGLAAAAMGADALEVHITFSKEMFGPDVPVSLDMDELSALTTGVRYIRRIINNPVDKNEIANELSDMRGLFNKSIVANKDLQRGTILSEDMITFKKPGTGISPDKLNLVLGKKINRDIQYDELIQLSDVE